MSSFTLEDHKFILDATSSWRQMWFDKNHPNAIYCDKRSEAELEKAHTDFETQRGHPGQPCRFSEKTIAQDFRKLDFPDEHFRLIVFDPPHLKWLGENSLFRKKYGCLNADTWQQDITKAANELWRVLRPYGVLIFKWADHDIPYTDVLKCFPAQPLFGQISARGRRKQGGEAYHTYWFTFMKIPEGATPEHKVLYELKPGQLQLMEVCIK